MKLVYCVYKLCMKVTPKIYLNALETYCQKETAEHEIYLVLT